MASTERTEPSIYDEILSLETQSQVSSCTVGTILDDVDEETREGLLKALANPGIKGTLITKALEARGFRLSSHTLQRHRRGGCSCGK